MKINKLFIILLLGISALHAQNKIEPIPSGTTKLNLKEAIEIAVSKSNEAILADTKAETRNLELQSLKSNRYPDVKISGQYLRLTNATIDLKQNSSSSGNSGESPKVNQLMLGQANVNMPLFSGFRLGNSINASENVYKAEIAKSAQTKEEIAMKVVEAYANLYRAQKAVDLIKENLKSAQQRVTDFTALEKNEIIARNDLLKAQLQESKVQLTLDEANKNVSIINYSLVNQLKLSDDYKIGIDEHQFDNAGALTVIENEEAALKNRKDLESVHYLEQASQSNVKVAKSGYYPTLSLVGGYTALDLQNVVRVENAINFGVGVSYNLSSILKNGKEVKIAKSRELETKQSGLILSEQIKIEVQQAIENYNLAVKQNAVYEQAISQTSENYRIVKDKYDNGLSNTNDLLEADVEQLNSKINYAYARANIMLKYYEMLSVSGELTSSFNLQKN